MNELENLKKKLLELSETARVFLNARIREAFSKITKGRDINLVEANLRLGLVIVVVCLTVGFFMGYVARKVRANPTGTGGAGFSFLQSVFPKKTFFPGTQADGSFIFSNFESPKEIGSWKLIGANLEPSANYAWEGTWSGKVTFFAGKELAAITLDDLGRNRKLPSDWSDYGSLQFYIFQPGTKSEKLTLIVSDLWGKQYEESLTVSRGKWEKFSVPIKNMAKSVNIKKINQVSISRRERGAALDFYFDAVRLIPSVSFSGNFKKENMFDYGFAQRKAAWTFQDPHAGGEFVHVPFVVKNETGAFCHLCVVEGGIPLPMGEVQDPRNIRINNLYGEDIPFQSRVLAYWPDRSIKWIALHFESTLRPGDGAGYFLDYGPNIHSLDFSSRLKVTEDDQSIKVDTGVLEAILSKKSFYLFDQVFLDQNGNGSYEPGEQVTSHAVLTLQFRGKEFRADLDSKTYKIEIEEKGSQRVVVKASSWFQSEDGGRYCQVVVRYYFYQGKSDVKIAPTLVYTGYPENKQYPAYKMLKLPDNETIDAFGIRMPYQFSEARDEQVFVGMNQTMPPPMPVANTLKFFQNDYDSATSEDDGNPAPMRDAYAGWMDMSNQAKGIAVAVRHFRENFPKAFKLDRQTGMLEIDLWPKEAGPIDLATSPEAVGPDDYGRSNAFGLAKTHELMFYFHAGNAAQADALNVSASFMEPLMIRTNPYWIDATGALGRLYPADPKYATEERMLDRLFDWAERQPRNFKWYGMFNFGDTLTWWREDDGDEKGSQKYSKPGWHPVGRWGWYNCEGVGTHTGALLQFVRTGQWKYFEFGENLAKHIMDVDTVHYDTIASDKRLRGVLNEKYSHVGAMHRHSANHWSGRTDEASHTNVLGILLYYYLTGNERAFDVAKEIGDYFLSEPFTYIDRPDLAPHRAMANALWGDVLLYEVTWDDRYKKAAEKIIKIYLKGQQPDGSFLENYNTVLGNWAGEKHELYMGGYLVGALMAYYELTQDEAVKEMFLRLVRYLAPTEYTGPTILHGIAYAYLITKDPFFIAMIEDNMRKILSHQQFSNDPLMNGLIYDKPIYHRPMAFLSTVPYVFGALEEYFKEQGK